MSTPDIHLYTAATMNGYKPVIFLEEAGVPYDLTHINFSKQEQKSPAYLALNPNGKIPTLVDRFTNRTVFESGAILWYLAEKYGQFLPAGAAEKSDVMQWMFFQAAHVGPMMGQAMYFQRIAAPNGQEEPFSIKRYVDESRRILEVLNNRLEGREWIAADTYSIADMMIYPWARAYVWAKVSIHGLAHLQTWFDRIDAREAVQKALTIPKANPQFWDETISDEAFAKENAARFASDVKKP
ncbi:MAG: glutathione S-transferase N-terminal domain-containing protein [Aquisalinus sp.]|nr:glutathione S-transferase N-terminal domain-containing protein [Aquisalinus sp.]